jgi:hypothetical protein
MIDEDIWEDISKADEEKNGSLTLYTRTTPKIENIELES